METKSYLNQTMYLSAFLPQKWVTPLSDLRPRDCWIKHYRASQSESSVAVPRASLSAHPPLFNRSYQSVSSISTYSPDIYLYYYNSRYIITHY